MIYNCLGHTGHDIPYLNVIFDSNHYIGSIIIQSLQITCYHAINIKKTPVPISHLQDICIYQCLIFKWKLARCRPLLWVVLFGELKYIRSVKIEEKILTGPTYELLLNFTVISYVSYGLLFSIKLHLPVLSYSVDLKAPCEHWNPLHNKSALVHIMARRWLGDKPYSELKPIQFIGANKRHYGIYLLCAALALERLIPEKL